MLLFILLLLALSFSFRVYDSFGHWVWEDEITTLDQVYSGYYETTADAPMYPFILRSACSLTQWCDVDALRFYTLCIATFLPILGFLFARKISNNLSAMCVGVLYSCLGFFVIHSQNIRPYSLLMLVALGFYFYFWRFVRSGKGLHTVFVLLVLLAITHLISAQIFISVGVTAILYFYLTRRTSDVLNPLWGRYSSLLKLFAVLAIAGLLGTMWMLPRIDTFLGAAYQETASFQRYLLLLVKIYPLGFAPNYWVKVVSFVFFAIGAIRLFKDEFELFILFFVLIVVSGVLTYSSLGERVDWLSTIGVLRYFSHTIIVSTLVVGLGVGECIARFGKKGRYICGLLFIAFVSFCAWNTFVDSKSRHFVRDRFVHSYEFARSVDVDGVLFKPHDLSVWARTIKVISLLKTYHGDESPFYSLVNEQLRVEPNVKPDNLILNSRVAQAKDFTPGLYIANTKCSIFEKAIRRQVSGFQVLDAVQQNEEEFLCSIVSVE